MNEELSPAPIAVHASRLSQAPMLAAHYKDFARRCEVDDSVLLERSASFNAVMYAPSFEADVSDLEALGLIHTVAMFGWANRLMAHLGSHSESPVAA